MPEITTTQLNRAVHRAVLDEPEVKKILCKVVAEQLGLDLESPHVSARVVSTTHQEGSLGTHRPRFEVELIDDHAGKPRTGIEHPADGTMSPPIAGDGSGQALPEVGA